MPPDPPTAHPVEGRVSIGNPSIDAMLEGGLVPHRPYLLVGPSGTGKTKLVLQFLCEGVRRGERVLLVTLEEPPNEVRLNHRALEPELNRVEVFDAIPDVMRYERAPFKDIASVRQITPFAQVAREIRRSPELASVEVTVTALEQMLRSEVVRRGYSRIAIDSLTALQYFCMKGFDPVGGAQTFLRFVSDLRTTTLLTVESPLEDVETTERALARGEIRLFRWELDGVTVRAIGVEKLRGSSHDARLHPYRIGPQGIDVNLAVTISRDTRQIVEAPPTIVPPVPAAPAPPARPALAPLSEEVRDLIALGVNVEPVRGTVEAALAAVRAGRSDEAAQQIARLTLLTGALAASVAGDIAPAPADGSPSTDAQRRVAQRADAMRVGQPPTLLPPPEALEEQLGRVLEILPAARPEPTRPPSRTTSPATPPPPAPVAAVEPPVSVAAPVVPPKTPATTPTPAPPPTSAPPAVPERPGPTASIPTPRAAPSRATPVRASPPPPMPEPPPLPRALPASPPTSSARGTAASTSPSTAPTRPTPAPSSGLAPPPPLPVPSSAPTSAPVAPRTAPGPPEPAVKRRRRAAPAKRKSAAAPEEAAGAAAADDPSAAKPKRRAVRRRKAPPVVAATAEPLPTEDAATPPPTPPPAGAE